jgi:calcineurin-like phosphoesterase
MGMTFMPACDNPFKCMDGILEEIATAAKNIIVDFHAEATSEKKSMAYYLSGRVSAVIGTHTHVQTADEQIIDGKTAFISDVGMVGAVDSVIGAQKEIVKIFTDYYPMKFHCPDGKTEFNAVVLDIDTATGIAESIKRIKKII